MNDDVLTALAQALEATLRDVMSQEADPAAYLDGVGQHVLPTLLSGMRPDGTLLRDPANAAVVAAVFSEVVAKLRREWPR